MSSETESACPSWLQFGRPDETFRRFGIAIGSGALGPSGHVGLIHRDQGKVRFLHLAWHYKLSEEEMDSYGWVVSPLADEHAKVLAARCRSVAKRFAQKGLPYAPAYRNSHFNDRVELVLGADEHGFTCATFILAVFHHAGFPLVSTATWPSREDDSRFHDMIVQELESNLDRLRQKITIYEVVWEPGRLEALRQQASSLEQHIEKVRSENFAARFRPEEVAAASALEEPPVAFAQVVEPAAAIATQLAARAVTFS